MPCTLDIHKTSRLDALVIHLCPPQRGTGAFSDKEFLSKGSAGLEPACVCQLREVLALYPSLPFSKPWLWLSLPGQWPAEQLGMRGEVRPWVQPAPRSASSSTTGDTSHASLLLPCLPHPSSCTLRCCVRVVRGCVPPFCVP